MAKKKENSSGIVYSTDPSFRIESGQEPEPVTLPPGKQRLVVRLDTKNRSGKAVTLVDGFTGTSHDLEVLGKQLKAFCGTGGSVKDGQVIIQGDQRPKVVQWLKKNGYTGVGV